MFVSLFAFGTLVETGKLWSGDAKPLFRHSGVANTTGDVSLPPFFFLLWLVLPFACNTSFAFHIILCAANSSLLLLFFTLLEQNAEMSECWTL